MHPAVVALIAGLLVAGCSSGKPAAKAPTTTANVGSSATAGSGTTATTGASSSARAQCSEFHAQITEADSGGEVNVGDETSRFSICLDETKHPLSQLSTAGCPFGYVSNLSLAGPDNYPIGYQVTATGSCIVRDGDYQVRVITTG